MSPVCQYFACLCFSSFVYVALSDFQGLCDFQTDFCSWINDKSDGSEWQRMTGRSQNGLGGPYTDHTLNEDGGYYLYLRDKKPSDEDTIIARLLSKMLNQTHTCLAFWYSIYGSAVLSLRVLQKNGGLTTRELWSVTGNQGNMWKRKAFEFDHDGDFQFVLEGTKRNDGYVALDDVSLTGSCLDCDFKHGPCNWSNDSKVWKIVKKPEYGYTKPPNKQLPKFLHSCVVKNLRTVCSWYADQRNNSFSCAEHHRFWSNISARACPATLKFKPYVKDGNGTYIKVFVQDTLGRNIFNKNVEEDTVWKAVTIPISTDVEYTVMFEASSGSDCLGQVALDDITLMYGSCPNSEFKITSSTPSTIGSRISTDNVYVGTAVGLVAILIIASVVIFSVIRKRRRQASREKPATFGTQLEAMHKHGDKCELETTSNTCRMPHGNDERSYQCHLNVHNANNYSYAEMPDVWYSHASNTTDEKACTTPYERKNIPQDNGALDDIYETTCHLSSKPRDDTYDHTSPQDEYDSVHSAKKNATVDPTYSHISGHDTYDSVLEEKSTN